MELKNRIETVAYYYGYMSQSEKCIEEMAEATQAICKDRELVRDYRSQEVEPHMDLSEELADALLTIIQVIELRDIAEPVQEEFKYKLQRQENRMRIDMEENNGKS